MNTHTHKSSHHRAFHNTDCIKAASHWSHENNTPKFVSRRKLCHFTPEV